MQDLRIIGPVVSVKQEGSIRPPWTVLLLKIRAQLKIPGQVIGVNEIEL